jgi:hypothetical protein
MFILVLNDILSIWTLLYFEFLLTVSEICVLQLFVQNCPASCACGADAAGVRGGGTQMREGGMRSMGYRGGGHVE